MIGLKPTTRKQHEQALNVFGLLVNLDGQTKKFGDLYSVLRWMGLGALVLGTLLQLWATVERR